VVSNIIYILETRDILTGGLLSALLWQIKQLLWDWFECAHDSCTAWDWFELAHDSCTASQLRLCLWWANRWLCACTDV